jgi:hypothetical protein
MADPTRARCDAPNSRLLAREEEEEEEEEQDAKRKPAAPGKRPTTMKTMLPRSRSSPRTGWCLLLVWWQRRAGM